MRRALAIVLSLALCLGGLSGCGPGQVRAQPLSAQPVVLTQEDLAAHAQETPAVQSALAGFGLELLQKTRGAEKSPVLLSPLSVALALGMAANGSGGETRAQFEQVLGSGAGLDAVNAAYAALLRSYGELGGSTECSIANSVWADLEGQIFEEFIGKCQGVFDAQVFQQELSAPAVVPALNGWVSEHTEGMIPKIIGQPFEENAAALLVNALYLKNTWETEFSPNATYLRGFWHQEGEKEAMDFLNASYTSFPYLQAENAQGAVLPYDDGRLAFFALMPEEGAEFEVWLNSLDGDALASLLEGRRDTEFRTLALPKFEAEWSGQLQDVLSAMGLDRAFTAGTADFSLLGDHPYGYFLSQAIHAAKIEVNEEGTQAAAATVMEVGSGASAPPETGLTLIFDRPFLYGIVDLETGVPLFLGTFE